MISLPSLLAFESSSWSQARWNILLVLPYARSAGHCKYFTHLPSSAAVLWRQVSALHRHYVHLKHVLFFFSFFPFRIILTQLLRVGSFFTSSIRNPRDNILMWCGITSWKKTLLRYFIASTTSYNWSCWGLWEPEHSTGEIPKLNLGPRQTSVYFALLSDTVDICDANVISYSFGFDSCILRGDIFF